MEDVLREQIKTLQDKLHDKDRIIDYLQNYIWNQLKREKPTSETSQQTIVPYFSGDY